jgi:hypothetical protein
MVAGLSITGNFTAHRTDNLARRHTNIYRVTTRALAALGHPTLESLQAYLEQVVESERAQELGAQAAG